MKTYSSLEKLLEHCRKCPSCHNQRNLNISLGDDEIFGLESWTADYTNNVLSIKSEFRVFPKPVPIVRANVTHHISTKDGTFWFEIENNDKFVCSTDTILDCLRSYDFWFAIYANCTCSNSVNSLDVEFDYTTNTIHNIGVEQEAVWLKNTDYKLHISLHPQQKIMRVTKLIEDKDTGDLLDNSDEIKLPLMELDWSQEQQAVDRIRTMMVFS